MGFSSVVRLTFYFLFISHFDLLNPAIPLPLELIIHFFFFWRTCHGGSIDQLQCPVTISVCLCPTNHHSTKITSLPIAWMLFCHMSFTYYGLIKWYILTYATLIHSHCNYKLNISLKMSDEMWLRQIEHIRGHFYSVSFNKDMVVTIPFFHCGL